MSRPVVLIADDDEEVALLLRTYLKPLECEILTARDGEEALAVAQARLPDAVLLALMEHPGRVLSRAQLEERLYGWGEEVESNVVEVYVHALRRKLGSGLIRTVRGAGYRLETPGGRCARTCSRGCSAGCWPSDLPGAT